MSAPSLAQEPNRLQTARTTRYDRHANTSVTNFVDSPDFATPPLTLPDELESVDFGTDSPAYELPATREAKLAVTAPHTRITKVTEKTTLIPLPIVNLPAEAVISDHTDSPINNLRATFEQSLNQTLDHLRQYLLAAVEAQIKTSVQTAELPAPQEFLAQVRDIVQAAVAPNTYQNPNPGSLGGLRPIPKLSFLNRPHGKWVDSSPVLVTDEKLTPSISLSTKPTTQETAKVETPISAKTLPHVTNPIPSPADKLPWEAQNPFL